MSAIGQPTQVSSGSPWGILPHAALLGLPALALLGAVWAVGIENRAEGLITAERMRSASREIEDWARQNGGAYPDNHAGTMILAEGRSQGLDGWGQHMVYMAPSVHSGHPYDIISFGRNGQPGGEGEDRDRVHWQEVGP
jgi:hypothetical protein